MSDASKSHPDLKFLKQQKLINDHLLINLINDRRSFSHRATNGEITKEECLKQISIELNLMGIFKLEINKKLNPNVSNEREKEKILSTMTYRIDHLYFSMFQMFPIECEPLIEYMEFQAKNKTYTTNKIHVLMSKQKCHPELYIAAATLQYKNKNIEGARFFFAEGIKIHKNCKPLYLEELWVEVQHLKETKGTSFEVGLLTYKNTIKYFANDMDFHFMLLKKSIQLKPINKLHCTIISDLVEKYKQSGLMWQQISMLCFEGFVYFHDTHMLDYTDSYEFRARCCINLYQIGLKNVTAFEDKHNLLRLFTDFTVNLWKKNRSKKNVIDDFARKAMERAFKMGHGEFGGLHKPEYYVYWATHRNEIRIDVIQLAIENNKHNINVWAEMLKFYTNNFGCVKMAKTIFEAGVVALENQSLRLWEILESYWNNNDLKQLEKLYFEGANSPYADINSVYGVKYLQMYNKLCDTVSTEEQQVDVNFIRNLHKTVCTSSSVNEICLWIEYIRFEFKNGSSTNARHIYDTAMKIQTKPFSRNVLKYEYDLLRKDYEGSADTVKPVVIDLLDGE